MNRDAIIEQLREWAQLLDDGDWKDIQAGMRGVADDLEDDSIGATTPTQARGYGINQAGTLEVYGAVEVLRVPEADLSGLIWLVQGVMNGPARLGMYRTAVEVLLASADDGCAEDLIVVERPPLEALRDCVEGQAPTEALLDRPERLLRFAGKLVDALLSTASDEDCTEGLAVVARSELGSLEAFFAADELQSLRDIEVLNAERQRRQEEIEHVIEEYEDCGLLDEEIEHVIGSSSLAFATEKDIGRKDPEDGSIWTLCWFRVSTSRSPLKEFRRKKRLKEEAQEEIPDDFEGQVDLIRDYMLGRDGRPQITRTGDLSRLLGMEAWKVSRAKAKVREEADRLTDCGEDT